MGDQAPPPPLPTQPLPPVVAQQPYGAPPPPPGPQPGPQWMPPPPSEYSTTGCPPGLEYLTQLESVNVEQSVDILEIITGFDVQNRFKINNNLNQRVYFAQESSSTLMRLCCGPNRGFTYRVTDNNQLEVFRVVRPFECGKGCYCCPMESCRYFATVEDKNGVCLGHISNLQFCMSPTFGLYDANRELICEIRGPCCPIQNVCCKDDIDFPVIELSSGSQNGTISKVWGGFLKEMYTKADNYRVTFPVDLDVKKKAVMISAALIMDMMIFERSKNNH